MTRPKLTLKATVSSRGDALGYLEKPGDAVIVDRQGPRWLILMCPCGCGEAFPINLDPRAGPAWRLYKHERAGLSLYPSVWKKSECGSHYVIWRNKIFLFNRHEDDFRNDASGDELPRLKSIILDRLPRGKFVSYDEIAESIGEIPWDVLLSCRKLVKEGLANERAGKHKGYFKRR